VKILFITSNRLGDAVLSTGVLGHLVASQPQARLTIACGPLAAPLFRAVPGLERLIELVKQPRHGHWRQLWRDCIGTRWDLIVDVRNSLVSRLLWSRRRLVMVRPRPGQHRVEQLARSLRLSPPPAPRLWFTPADRAAAEALIPLEPAGPLPGAELVLALAPAANWRAKTWRAERFAALAQRLTGPGGLMAGARCAVFAAPNECQQVAPVLAAVPAQRRIDLVGRVDPQLAAACLARCSLFIGNDSGLMHLAAAAGTPTLGLFGPGHPELYAPWGPAAAVVTTPLWGEALMASIPGFDHRTSDTLMDGLTVDAVADAAAALWTRNRREPELR